MDIDFGFYVFCIFIKPTNLRAEVTKIDVR